MALRIPALLRFWGFFGFGPHPGSGTQGLLLVDKNKHEINRDQWDQSTRIHGIPSIWIRDQLGMARCKAKTTYHCTIASAPSLLSSSNK